MALRPHELDRFAQLQVGEQVQRVEEGAGDPSAVGVAVVAVVVAAAAAAAGESREGQGAVVRAGEGGGFRGGDVRAGGEAVVPAEGVARDALGEVRAGHGGEDVVVGDALRVGHEVVRG